ncbi:NEDD4-binding protein 1 isoform X3 [Corythoichthys intestinalis]|uniref:NEDD4-binding protein 1 isoform X3 n=1 Tax=Corythoichthys intestinalis TaxID=161448 RepID=UPI0025A5914A|nr:NEDD4-binding protein 1 isoform X3 [Corythoichthys intestinalis]
MSTTRPLLGKNQVTELAYVEQPTSRATTSVARQHQDTVTDEFTVLENKESELKCARPRVEHVFKVTFTIIGLLDYTGQAHGSTAPRQIWLQLRGNADDVSKAKEYVRGLCDPELQKEEHYPVDMHCIFAGARGLFLDRLIRDTSAEVMVPEPGRLRLLGRAEPVVMAQSRVQQFVALFQEKRSLMSDKEQAVKREFKSFVEERDDKYTMELLLLPSALKEELLGLAHSPTSSLTPSLAVLNQNLHSSTADLEQDRSQSSTPVTELSIRILDTSFEDKGTRRLPFGEGAGKAGGGTCSGVEALLINGIRPSHKRRSSESETRDTKRQYSLERRDESPERSRDRERHRVRECIGASSGYRTKNASTSSTISSYTAKANTVAGPTRLDPCEGFADESEAVSPETNLRCLVNFFRTMGYQQEVVERVIKDTGQTEDTFLILEKIVAETNRCAAETRGLEETKLNNACSSDLPSNSSVNSSLAIEREHEPGPSKERIKSNNSTSTNGLGHRRQCSGSESTTQQLVPLTSRPSAYQTLGHMGFHGSGARNTHSSNPPAPPVTGLARFHQSLKTPYKLKLPNEPGRPDLRHIIIDGSNVAMAHGLHRFFSCRGIALAVETFWKLGHREITVFVPQWRQKRDPFTTEQHFLNQLEDLRLLSFTPSREVCGQRIASHDDRFLLHLAEKTDGIIVTNDNLRDFVNTSDMWRRIIQERLLQFTFVEDHFMIPDDPLGKKGPHLDLFLRKINRHLPITPPPRRPPDLHPSIHQQNPVYVQALHSAPWTPDVAPQPPHSHPGRHRAASPSRSPPPQRSPGETSELKRQLCLIFPEQNQQIDRILKDNPYMRDLNALSGLLLG